MQRRVTPPRRITSPTWGPHLHVNRPYRMTERRGGYIDRLEQGLGKGMVSILLRRTSELVVDLHKGLKVIFCRGDFSALKDFEKVIQESELHRRRENNH